MESKLVTMTFFSNFSTIDAGSLFLFSFTLPAISTALLALTAQSVAQRSLPVIFD